MLTITNNGFKKPIPFKYIVDGEETKLHVVQMSVEDEIFKAAIERDVMKDETLDESERSAKILIAKICATIKTPKGERVFNMDSNIPADVVLALLPHCQKMNPVPETAETLETRKKKS